MIFSAEHIGVLVTLTLVTTALCVWLRRTRHDYRAAAAQRRVCRALALVLIATAVFEQFHAAATGRWDVTGSLPLHLCDIGVWVTAIALWLVTRDPQHPVASPPAQSLYELAYFWGLGGTLQAIITPDVEEPFPHIVFFRFFITHGGIVVGALAMTIGLGLRPRRSAPWRVWRLTLALALVVLGINAALWALGYPDANYMYLGGPADNPTILDHLGPWPWSLLSLAALGTALIALLYAPFWIVDHLRPAQTPG